MFTLSERHLTNKSKTIGHNNLNNHKHNNNNNYKILYRASSCTAPVMSQLVLLISLTLGILMSALLVEVGALPLASAASSSSTTSTTKTTATQIQQPPSAPALMVANPAAAATAATAVGAPQAMAAAQSTNRVATPLDGVAGLVGGVMNMATMPMTTITHTMQSMGLPSIATAPLSAVSSLFQQAGSVYGRRR